MYADTSKRKLIIIGSVSLFIVAIIGLIGGVLFLGKPLGFQYANAKKQVQTAKEAQSQTMDAVTAYFDANTKGEPAEEFKERMQSSAEDLADTISQLENEAAIKRDDEVQKSFQAYREKGEMFVGQVKDIVTTVDKTSSLRDICNSELFDKVAKAETREAGWRVFEPCAQASEKFNPNDLPDPDYRLAFVSMKKLFKDTKTYLTEDESLYDDVTMRLATLGPISTQVDLDVQTRLRETLNSANINSLESLLASKQE